MQGSVFHGYDGGPVSAEWNVVANVAAARKVLSAPWQHVTITPLDTCGRVSLSGPRFQQLVKSEDRLTRTVLENYRIWAKKKRIDERTLAPSYSTLWPSTWPRPTVRW